MLSVGLRREIQIQSACYNKQTWEVQLEVQTRMCQCSTSIFKAFRGSTVLDMLEAREMAEQVDWLAKQPSHVAWASENLKSCAARGNEQISGLKISW